MLSDIMLRRLKRFSWVIASICALISMCFSANSVGWENPEGYILIPFFIWLAVFYSMRFWIWWNAGGFYRAEETVSPDFKWEFEASSGKKIEDITDIGELFLALRKRKSWNCIPHDILRQIFDNADGDVEKVQRFRFVSELHRCVDNNFIPLLEDNSDLKMTVAWYSLTLERLAAQAAQSCPGLPDGSQEQDMAIGTAEIAYMSSILCNPLMLPSYVGLAEFYMIFGSPDRAAEVCHEYDIAEKKLLSSDDSDLGYYNQAMKSDTTESRQMIDQIRDEAGSR